MSYRGPGKYLIKSGVNPLPGLAPGVWSIDQQLQYTKSGSWMDYNRDPYFANNVVLLHGDGLNTANNNSYIANNYTDSTVHTLTKNGNVALGSFSPYYPSEGEWSGFFNSVSDYLVTPSSASFAYGTGDFTWEMWVYPTASDWTSSNRYFIDHNSNEGVIQYNSNILRYYNPSTGTGSVLYTGNGTITPNTWTHIAVTRESGTTRIFKNGIMSSSASDSYNYGNKFVTIANYGSTGQNFLGYISNVRIVKGTALYKSNFSPPTKPLTAITGTSLLTCQSNIFKDNSANKFLITSYNSKVSKFKPFLSYSTYSPTNMGGSVYFDGTGDYLTVPSSTSLQVPTGDFTMECWYYCTVLPVDGEAQVFLQKGRAVDTTLEYQMYINNSSGVYSFNTSYSTTGSDAVTTTANISLVASTWTHFAYVKSGTTITMYVNGVSVATITSVPTIFSSTGVLGIGGNNAGSTLIKGYLSDVRIVKGTAVYTGNFNPSSVPLTGISNTTFLMHCNNAGIYDSSCNRNLETIGNTQISTTQKKFGSSSIYFDGVGDIVTAPASNDFLLGLESFTLECWIYPTFQSTTGQAIFTNRGTNATSLWFGFPPDYFYPVVYTSIGVLQSTISCSINTWNHVALSRLSSEGVLRIFVNGVESASISTPVNFSTGNICSIGGESATNALYFYGYISDFRLTKGVCRYQTSFTPPTRKLPDL